MSRNTSGLRTSLQMSSDSEGISGDEEDFERERECISLVTDFIHLFDEDSGAKLYLVTSKLPSFDADSAALRETWTSWSICWSYRAASRIAISLRRLNDIVLEKGQHITINPTISLLSLSETRAVFFFAFLSLRESCGCPVYARNSHCDFGGVAGLIMEALRLLTSWSSLYWILSALNRKRALIQFGARR